MTAILGGVMAAIFFAGATLASARSTRMLGAVTALGGVMLVGFIAAAPIVLLTAGAELPGSGDIPWLILAGAGNVAGLLFEYFGLRSGKVGLVSAVAAAEGAVAALLAIVFGEVLAPLVGVGVTVVGAGVVLTAFAPDPPGTPVRTRRALLFGALAALAFGSSLYATGRIGSALPLGWALVPARLVGVAAITLPLAAAGRFRVTRSAAPFIVLGGLCEVGGFASFVWGATGGIAVSAALSAQFASVSALAAWLLYGERLSRLQWIGVAIVAIGVATLAFGST